MPFGDVDGVVKPWPAGVHGAALWHLPRALRAPLAIVVAVTHGARWGTCVAPKQQPEMMGQVMGKVPKVGAQGSWFRRRRCCVCGVVGKNAEGEKLPKIG